MPLGADGHPDRPAPAGPAEDAASAGASSDAPMVVPGWRVHGWAGDRIGTVVERTADALLVRLDSVDGREIRIPLALVSTQDAVEMRATLSVDTSELEDVEPKTDRVDLLDGSA